MSNEEIALLAGAIGAAGAVLGALVSGLVTYITQRRRAKDEHDIWLRQERYQASAEFIAMTFQYVSVVEELRPSYPELLAATARVQVSSPPTRANQAQELQMAALGSVYYSQTSPDREQYEEHTEAFFTGWHQFVDDIRDDLGVPGDPPDEPPFSQQIWETFLERLMAGLPFR